MSPRRLHGHLLFIATALVLGLGACDLNPPGPASTPVSTGAAMPGASAEATATPSATPPVRATPVVFRPTPGPATARWERLEVDDPLPPHRAYRLASDEIWGLVRDDGVEMFFGGGPFLFFGPEAGTPVLLATAAEHEPAGETVTVDLATGEVTQVLSFGVNRVTWQAPGVVRFMLQHEVRRDGEVVLFPGAWLFDLVTSSLAPEIGTTDTLRFALPEPLPDATYHPGATAVLIRPNAASDDGALVLVDEDKRTERVMEQAVSAWSPSVSPDGRWLAYVTAANELRVMDLGSGETRQFGVLAQRGRPMWSPDSRFLADAYQWYEGYHTVVFDAPAAFVAFRALPEDRIGPLEATWPAGGWHPSEPRLLLLGDYCLPDGMQFEELDATTGEVRRLASDVTGAWGVQWSPDGSTLAVAAPNLPIGLIDPVSGTTIPTPALERIEELQIFSWTAGGEWLVLGEMPGRGRCY